MPNLPQINRRDSIQSVDDIGLSFTAKDGPLIAVVGLTGGAGATTVALLLAAAAARDSPGAVVICDTGGMGADLAVYADAEAPQSLTAAARMIAENRRPPGLFATAAHGLRVIAAKPEPDWNFDEDGVARLLGDAKAAHALTVVDCGSLIRPADRFALGMCTHILWVLPATSAAVTRSRRRMAAVNVFRPRAEIVLARNDPSGRRAPVPELADLADDRGAPLILMPHVDDLADLHVDDVIEQAEASLQGLAVVLTR